MSAAPENQNWWERLRRNLAVPLGGRAQARAAAGEGDGLLNTEEFRRALHREWSRGQRIGLPLSMIAISRNQGVAQAESPSEVLEIFARELGERLRCTDIIGWVDTAKLGILLPHTSGNSAWMLIEQVRAKVAELNPGGDVPAAIEIKVYSSLPED